MFGGKNPFGGGATSHSATITTSSVSLFGQQTTPAFGGGAQMSNPFNSSTNPFAQPSETATTEVSSVFGTKTTSVPSLFGGAASSKPASFVASTSSSSSTTPMASVFGTYAPDIKSPASSNPALFGATFGKTDQAASAFGQPAAIPQQPVQLFGKGISTAQVTQQQTGSTQNLFGKPAVDITKPQSATSLFGKPMSDGGSKALFAQPNSSHMEQTTSAAKSTSSETSILFGKPISSSSTAESQQNVPLFHHKPLTTASVLSVSSSVSSATFSAKADNTEQQMTKSLFGKPVGANSQGNEQG